MDRAKRERLEQAGFRVGTAADFLGLTPEETEMVEIKVARNASITTRDDLADRTHPAASGDSGATAPDPETGR